MEEKDPKWEKVTGPEVLEGLLSGFDGIVPSASGIYAWKLCVGTRERIFHGRHMVEHIDKRCSSPVGTAEGRIGSTVSYSINKLTVSGKPLPEEKKQLLEAKASSEGNFRLWMERFLGTLDSFAPTLYVGETSDLSARVRDHLNGSTGFGKVIEDEASLSWDDLDFYYMTLDIFGNNENSAKFRKSLEYVTTMISVSGYVGRAG